MAEAAVVAETQERLIAAKKLRVAVGEDSRIVELDAGDPWPEDALGRLDVLIRRGFVIRWDETGALDRRSWPFARRLGIEREAPAPVRGFLARARALPQTASVRGRRIRVFPGRADGEERELFVVRGRAFPVLRGAPDSLAAREALRASGGGGTEKPRRREPSGGKRRRKRARTG